MYYEFDEAISSTARILSSQKAKYELHEMVTHNMLLVLVPFRITGFSKAVSKQARVEHPK